MGARHRNDAAPPASPAGDEPTTSAVLQVRNLRTAYPSRRGPVHAVDGVSFEVAPGEAVGVVGESGCGKSTVLKSLLGLVRPPGEVRSDGVLLGGRDLATLPAHDLRRARGGEISMVFQDPITTFNPSWTIGSQFRRVLKLHRPDLRRGDHEPEMLRLLRLVGIDGAGKLDAYPFEFSQGQLQRIAIAIACSSRDLKVLLADEPTTSLDVTIEAQVLQLLRRLRAELGLALVLVTHDLSVVAELCDRVIVMYAGKIVEDAAVTTLFEAPAHPYTQQLLKAIPSFPHGGERLYTMRGGVPDMVEPKRGCRFAPRCDQYIGPVCDDVTPGLLPIDGQRVAACHLYAPERQDPPQSAGSTS